MKVWTFAVAAAAVLLTGCTAVVPAGPAPSLKDTTWVVTELRTQPTLADFQPTISFGATGEVNGNNGCNQFAGTYTLNGTSLSFGSLAQTAMACLDGGRDQQEAAFGEAIAVVASVRFTGETVELLDAAGDVALLLAPVPPLELAGTSWVLTGLIQGTSMSSPADGDPVTLAFDADKVSGKACNTFNGSYTLDGDSIGIGPLMSTRMACTDDALNQQETFLLTVLQAATTATAGHGMLELTTADGRGLQFAKA